MDSKIIKGQAWIQGDSLVQEQILIVPNSAATRNVVVLIDNIWEDLTSDEGTYKYNGKNYFYWEYKMTDTEDDDSEITIKFECPRPKSGLFTEPYDPEKVNGKYSKYWVSKLEQATNNFEYKAAIQKKEIVFPGTSYVNQEGELVKVEETRICNNDLGDISNLLGFF